MAVLSLGATAAISHVFECRTSDGFVRDLKWTKVGGIQRFFTSSEPTHLSLDLGAASSISPMTDIGIYTCTDHGTLDTTSVNISQGIERYNLPITHLA